MKESEYKSYILTDTETDKYLEHTLKSLKKFNSEKTHVTTIDITQIFKKQLLGKQMKENKLELRCNHLADLMGWVSYKGQATDRTGTSDRLYLKQGAGWTAEIKKPDGDGVQSEGQKIEEQYLKSRGVPYYLIESLEEFRTAILIEEDKILRRQ